MMEENPARHGRLRLEVHGTPDPDPQFRHYYDGVRLVFYGADGSETVFFDTTLDMRTFLEWIAENEGSLRHEYPPIEQRPGETIADTQRRAYECMTDDMDEDIRMLVAAACWGWNQRHNIKSGMPGMILPRLIIGPGADGIELCNYIEEIGDDVTRYIIDIDDFLTHLPTLPTPTTADA